MSKTYKTCIGCGARLVEGAEQCNLCGWPVDGVDEPEADAAVAEDAVADETGIEEASVVEEIGAAPPEEAVVARPADRPARAGGGYCNQCGWKNPPGSRFCSQCGSRLQVIDAPEPADVGPAPPPARVDPKKPSTTPEQAPEAAASPKATVTERQAISRQVGIIVGAGLLLVVTLFLVTAVSKTWQADAPAQAAQQALPSAVVPEEEPLPAQLAEQAATLEAEIAQLDGDVRLAKQRDLLVLFINAGRLDRAAVEQQKIAESTGAIEDWKRAGDLLYDWMNTIPEPQRKAQVASQAVAAYQAVLEQTPDNHDVRTDMATAYLNTGNPMQGVTEVKRVLEADPTHLNARFNYGLMLTWINRPDQAIEQFEQVKALVDESSDYYQKANEAIRAIRQGGSL